MLGLRMVGQRAPLCERKPHVVRHALVGLSKMLARFLPRLLRSSSRIAVHHLIGHVDAELDKGFGDEAFAAQTDTATNGVAGDAMEGVVRPLRCPRRPSSSRWWLNGRG